MAQCMWQSKIYLSTLKIKVSGNRMLRRLRYAMQQNDNDCTHKNYVSYFLLNILIVPKEKKG